MAPSLPAYSDDVLARESAVELLHLLIREEDRVPRNVIDECARRGGEMVELLGDLLQKEYYWGDDQTGGEWWLLLHAVTILGLIPEARAGELLVHYMRRMDEAEDEVLQEWLAGYWPALFRNKPDGVLPALRALGEELDRGWYIRVDAVNAAIAAAQARGAESLDEALAWAAGIAFREDEDYDVRVLVGNTLLNFARPEYRAQLEALADLQPYIGRCFDRPAIDHIYAAEGHAPDWERMADPWAFYNPEAIESRQREWAEELARLDHMDDDLFSDEPYVRAAPKIGRNDPCPCGSGKKYKKCCLK